MSLDVRTPAGALFLVLGALLLAYGLASDAAVYQRSLGINVNLWWGAVMMAFGAVVLLWSVVAPAVATDPTDRAAKDQLAE
jgi:hypothetical protein